MNAFEASGTPEWPENAFLVGARQMLLYFQKLCEERHWDFSDLLVDRERESGWIIRSLVNQIASKKMCSVALDSEELHVQRGQIIFPTSLVAAFEGLDVTKRGFYLYFLSRACFHFTRNAVNSCMQRLHELTVLENEKGGDVQFCDRSLTYARSANSVAGMGAMFIHLTAHYISMRLVFLMVTTIYKNEAKACFAEVAMVYRRVGGLTGRLTEGSLLADLYERTWCLWTASGIELVSTFRCFSPYFRASSQFRYAGSICIEMGSGNFERAKFYLEEAQKHVGLSTGVPFISEADSDFWGKRVGRVGNFAREYFALIDWAKTWPEPIVDDSTRLFKLLCKMNSPQ